MKANVKNEYKFSGFFFLTNSNGLKIWSTSILRKRKEKLNLLNINHLPINRRILEQDYQKICLSQLSFSLGINS